MIASSRPYRLMAASMAVLLLVGGGLPLVQHACAMAARHGQTDEHPCPRSEHEQASAHYDMHGPMPVHSESKEPCPHETRPQASSAVCCTVQAAPGIVTLSVASKRSLKPVVVQAVVPTEALSLPDSPRSHALFFDTGPPPASVSLHLLHAVLLN